VTKSTIIANGLSYKVLINISCSDAKYSIVPLYCIATAHQNNHLLMWKWLAALNSLNKIIQQCGFKTDFIQIMVNRHPCNNLFTSCRSNLLKQVALVTKKYTRPKYGIVECLYRASL